MSSPSTLTLSLPFPYSSLCCSSRCPNPTLPLPSLTYSHPSLPLPYPLHPIYTPYLLSQVRGGDTKAVIQFANTPLTLLYVPFLPLPCPTPIPHYPLPYCSTPSPPLYPSYSCSLRCEEVTQRQLSNSPTLL